MTITANQLLQLFGKATKLGYSYSFDEDESGGYEIEIYWYDNEEKQVMNSYIDKKSNNCSYNEFNYVMEQLDKELNAMMQDKEQQERFKLYQKLQKEFGNN